MTRRNARRRGSASPKQEGSLQPLFLSRLVIEGMRCFVRAEVPLDAQVTVIIGQNGAGKTSIAEAIASLAPGQREGLGEFPLRQGAKAGRLAIHGRDEGALAEWRVGKDKKEANDREGRRRLTERAPVFVYGQYRSLRPPVRKRYLPVSLERLGVGSGVLDEPPLPEDLGDALRRPATRTLFDFDEYLFRDLSAYAALLEQRGRVDGGARRVWERLRGWLVRVDGARLQGVDVAEVAGRRTIAFRRGGIALPLGELSDGYRAMLAVVLDLVIRYSQIHGGLEDPLAGAGVVVIDEVDLNLHPRWQRKVIEQLVELFPGTQFVLTTHSPAIVQAAIDERDKRVRVLVLDEDGEGQGTTVRALTGQDIERLDGAEVDSVLVDDAVFGVASRYSPTYERVEDRAAALREKVESGDETAAERKELLKTLDELQGLMVREDRREGRGPLLSEIARTQIALLRKLDEAVERQATERGKPARGGKAASRASVKKGKSA